VALEVIALTLVTNNIPLKAKTRAKVTKITRFNVEEVLAPLNE